MDFRSRSTDATVGAGGASDSPGGSSKNERHRRFLQEARSASALNHPHVVTIYEVDEYEGIAAILRDQPAPRHTARPDVAPGVVPIVTRALAKDPAQRYESAGAMRAEPRGRPRAADAVLVPIALLLLAAASVGAWQMAEARRVRSARLEALPEIGPRSTCSGSRITARAWRRSSGRSLSRSSRGSRRPCSPRDA